MTKIELKTIPDRQDRYIVLCSTVDTAVAFIAGVNGNRITGFQWSFSDGSYRKGGSTHIGQVPNQILSDCVNASLSSSAIALIVAVDSATYLSVSGQLTASNSLEQNIRMTVTAAGLRTPQFEPTAKATRMIAQLGIENALPLEVARVASDWQPPSVNLPIQVSGSGECDDDELLTGLTDIQCVKTSALLHLYQALADAETQPWIHYDLELFVVGDTLVDVVPLKTRMRTDSPLRYGNVAGVFSVQNEERSINYLDLLDALLLKIKSADGTSVVPLDNPLLGEPRTWMAAATSPSISYWAFGGADLVGEAPSTSHARAECALVRSAFAQYPSDPSLFNANAPINLSMVLPGDPDLTYSEAKWLRYKANVASLEHIVSVRASSYPGLSAAAIQKRRAYRKLVTATDATAAAIHHDFALREVGWDEYMNNKNFDFHQRAVNAYDQGRATIYAASAQNAKATSLRIDLQPRTTAQLQQYKVFASDSYIAKISTATRFDKNLAVTGTVCGHEDGNCSQNELSKTPATLEFTLGPQTQQKFNNVVDIGRVTVANRHDGAGFGADVPNPICSGADSSGPDSFAGQRSVRLQITNKGATAHVRLASAGSRVEAHWKTSGGATDDYQLNTDVAAMLEINFTPRLGDEDLSIVYVLGESGPLATITIDYSQTADERYRIIELDSGDFSSSNNAGWLEFQAIGLGPAPLGYSLLKTCMWLTGDRKCNEYSECKWSQTNSAAVIAIFRMQGHKENSPGFADSRGHLRAVYELKANAPALR